MAVKKRHNKKRNTAFLYEILVRELTKAIVENDSRRKKSVLRLIKEFYYEGSALHKELDLYHALLDQSGVEEKMAEKILNY